MYDLLAWKWIDEKFDVLWKYLLCFIVVHTAFLLCGADMVQSKIVLKRYLRVRALHKLLPKSRATL